ncbi:hypothetical protein CYMTET_12163 [Cymbomonas tetramitiformis]|uniref:Uncharacterized protein n=1 Tax=Cymbomonas tetramitiformis TaxID=36881 RepID=A0AAE0GL41_9CHLO|nr:hypothetical protein CYMTET_12163 [Cymbomonas tetramitiformis]
MDATLEEDGMVGRSSTASPPSPSTKAGIGDNNTSTNKKDSAHHISFHVTSSACIPEWEARNSLRQLKQAAGGAGEEQHFPMLHFDYSATTVENDTVKNDTVDVTESDTSDNGMTFRKQFADSEPPASRHLSWTRCP